MPKKVLLQSFVSLGGTDLSSYCFKIELTVDVEDKDTTTFTSGGFKEVLGGLKSGKLALTFKQDVAVAALDSILWPLLGTVVTFETRLDSAAVGTSNPKYTGSVLVNGWAPIKGSVGDVAEADLDMPTTGPIVRATS